MFVLVCFLDMYSCCEVFASIMQYVCSNDLPTGVKYTAQNI